MGRIAKPSSKGAAASSIHTWIFRGLFLILAWIVGSLLLNTSHSLDTTSTEQRPLIQLLEQERQRKAQAADEKPFPTKSTPKKKVASASATTVAYVVTITSCTAALKNTVPFQIAEAAAVLRYSITKQQDTRYQAKFHAFYHPDAYACAEPLQALGFVLEERNTPVKVESIKGDVLRERIVKNGCCGERELIKLEAWTLIDYPIVVLLDLDVLVKKPLDVLFDFMMDSKKVPPLDDLLWRGNTTTIIPERVDFLYTVDYAMVSAKRKVKPTQGGFVVLRPNMEVYNEFVDIVTEGDFRDNGGWHGKTGKFWGAMTFQGLMPLYFQVLHPHRSVELNWCVWDNMCSPSRDDKTLDKDGQLQGNCLTQQENCEDCRNRPIEQVKLMHFTVCQKPWTCMNWHKDTINHRLCQAFHHAWFQERAELERSWGRTGQGSGTWMTEQFLGFCKSYGQRGYIPMEKPFGVIE